MYLCLYKTEAVVGVARSFLHAAVDGAQTLMLRRGIKDHIWRFARATAMRKARFKCRGCGERATEVDHIKPRKGYEDE